jgi:diguanylate cyclase
VIVRNVVRLGADLGMVTLAEGVESEDVWDRLSSLGCDEIQGFVLTRPLPPEDLATWIGEWTGDVHQLRDLSAS